MITFNLTGRVGTITVHGSDDRRVVRLSIATDRPVAKDAQGNRPTDWFTVACFNGTATFVEKYVTKGAVVAVTGTVSTSTYVRNDEKRSSVDFTASRVELFSKARVADEEASNDAGEHDAVVDGDEFVEAC